jgi:septal ring factor EnvC (AmiA/AmiB activator)
MRPDAARSRLPRSSPCVRRPAAFALCLCLGGPFAAADPADGAARLREVQAEIAALTATLATSGEELSAARERGFALEREIADTLARHGALAARIATRRTRIDELATRLARRRAALARAEARLADSAVARYALSLQPRLAVILNQDDARMLRRTLAYQDYLLRTHARQRADARARVEALEELEGALALETEDLRRLRHETEAQAELLRGLRDGHAELVAAIERRLDAGEARVQQLREDEQRLLALVERLRAAPAGDVAVVPGARPFAELEGRLAWPAPGRIVSMPGTAFREGGARWPGVFIETPEAAAVTAVAAGTVVFADWFRNLGQLVIVDHGSGFMSLYGNNAELVRAPGDVVAAGDVLARVRDGEGALPRGLYFELRAGTEPLDPRRWCVAR